MSFSGKTIVVNWAKRSAIKAFLSLDDHWKEIVTKDLSRVSTFDPDQLLPSLGEALVSRQSFRSILLFRIKRSGNQKARRYFDRFRIVFPAPSGIEIDGDIKGGLRIIHNCCVIRVAQAGENLSVGPFAVIGNRHNAAPVIGDNVTICANSTVIGGIHIGSNALVGASSFVLNDVAPNTVVGGNPAAILKNRTDSIIGTGGRI